MPVNTRQLNSAITITRLQLPDMNIKKGMRMLCLTDHLKDADGKLSSTDHCTLASARLILLSKLEIICSSTFVKEQMRMKMKMKMRIL